MPAEVANSEFLLSTASLIIAYVAISALFAAFVPIVQYETFLLPIGALFIPAFGVVLTDYYVLKKEIGHRRLRPV